jgi:hypothetical protein
MYYVELAFTTIHLHTLITCSLHIIYENKYHMTCHILLVNVVNIT